MIPRIPSRTILCHCSRILAAAVVVTTAVGCSDDGGQPSGKPSAQTPGTGGLYAVGGYLTTADSWSGYLTLVEDISDQGEVDLSRSVEFPDDMTFDSPGDGAIYVGLGSAPTIEKWIVNDEDALERVGRVSLENFGLGNAMGVKNPFHFIRADRAYFIDGKTLQAIVWDPQRMETLGSISLEGLHVEGLELGTNYVHRDGKRLILTARYWRLIDESAELLTRVAFIDTETDQVSYAEDRRCGNVAFGANDSEGNLYLASHPYQTGAIAVGAAGAPIAESCIIRLPAGTTEFDPDYYVNLDELAGGHAGGIVQGPGDTAFVLVYEGPDFDEANFAKAATKQLWRYHGIELGNEAGTFARVPGVDLAAAYALAFRANTPGGGSVPYLISVSGDFSEGRYFDVSAPNAFKPALAMPGFPGKAILVR